MPSGNSLYDNLEIRADATAEEIRQAYVRQQAKLQAWPHRTHEWRIRQREIEDAYHVLSDPASRQAYDRTHFGHKPDQASSPVDPEVASTGVDPPRPPSNEPDFPGLRSSTVQTWTLSRARNTPHGYEIVLEASSSNAAQAVRALKKRIPEQELQYDAVHQIWLVPHVHAEILAELFVNFRVAVQHSQEHPDKLVIPHFDAGPAPAAEPGARKPYPRQTGREETFAASPFPIQGTIIVVLVLLIGWNFFAGSDSQEQPVVVTVTPTPRATRAPIVTPTHTPTITPTPFAFVTTTKYPRVHLRRLPHANAPSLGYLETEDEFTVLARTSDSSWVQVQHGEATGWSASWTLNVEEYIEQLPILPGVPNAVSPQN